MPLLLLLQIHELVQCGSLDGLCGMWEMQDSYNQCGTVCWPARLNRAHGFRAQAVGGLLVLCWNGFFLAGSSLLSAGQPRPCCENGPVVVSTGATGYDMRAVPKGSNLESSLNRAGFWLHAGNHMEPGEEIRHRAYFHARKGSKQFGSFWRDGHLPRNGSVST